jgi:hypothetical protein
MTVVTSLARGEMVSQGRGVGPDSLLVQRHMEALLTHFYQPISTQWATPALRFLSLKQEWEDDTVMLSSITEIAMHPAYQQIIGMGPIAISFILHEMNAKTGHWFWALKSITGEDPVTAEKRGRIKEMTEAWLSWGSAQGYI